MKTREIYLTTEDDFELRGSFFEPGEEGKNKGVVFFHMLRKDRTVWNNMGVKLAKRGFPAVSIDLRGHGESEGSWQGFDEGDFRDMAYDARAAKEFLHDNHGELNVAYIGASIGANLALYDSCENGGVDACVLLSPGLEFHGINVENIAEEFEAPYFMIASEDDYYAWDSCQKLDKSFCTPENKSRFMQLKEAGHGTNIFEVNPQIQEEIIKWLEEVV